MTCRSSSIFPRSELPCRAHARYSNGTMAPVSISTPSGARPRSASPRRWKHSSVSRPALIELLTLLDELALPRAIATSSKHEHARHHLGAFDLTHRFHAIVAHGDYARGKPHPEPFLTAAERLGVAPAHCLALEDSWHGVRAASAAGMMTIMVPDLMNATPEMEELCVHIAADLHEVHGLMKAVSVSA